MLLIIYAYNKTNNVLTGEEELDALIGLDTIKKTIKKIKAYSKKNKNTKR